MQQALSERAVTYAAVGATRAADLLDYPPAGFRPLERRAVIGSGDERWEWAWTQVLSWGIQRRSGMRVEVEEAPPFATAQSYQPVGFDSEGTPVAPASVGADAGDAYLPDGTRMLRAGDSALLRIPVGPFRQRAACRVVYVVDEPTSRGFAYGTLAGHPERGEEAFLVERSSDGSVSIVIRAFSRPAHLGWWLVYPALRLAQRAYTNRYLRALAGPIPGAAPGVAASAAEPAAPDAAVASEQTPTDQGAAPAAS